LIAGALVVACVLWLAPGAIAAGTFTHIQVAVRQGDAAVLRGPCGDLGVIDTNQHRSPEVLAVLDGFGSRALEWIVVTHYDADHLGGVYELAHAPGVSVRAVYDRGGDREAKDSSTYGTYYDWATSPAVIRKSVEIGDSIGLCEGEQKVIFKVVSVGCDGPAPRCVHASEENDKGICLKITYKEFDAAVCGDVNGTDADGRTDVESEVARPIGQVEFAKVNHHGSAYSSNGIYVGTLQALAAVVSTGANSYGHPNQHRLDLWDVYGDVYRTQDGRNVPVDGNVTVTSDGETGFSVTTSASGKDERYRLHGHEGEGLATDAVGGPVEKGEDMTSLFVAWGVSAAALAGLAVVLGMAIGRGPFGILIDDRGRYSLTHFQIVLWTIVVFSLISGVFFGRLAEEAKSALAFTIPDELLVLVGISAGSAAVASVIKAQKAISHPERIAASVPPGTPGDKPRLAQIFLVEEGELADRAIDATKFQNFWITLILVVAYVALAISAFQQLTSPQDITALPTFSGTFVTLLGISHAAYVAGKVPDRPGDPDGLSVKLRQLHAVPIAVPPLVPAAGPAAPPPAPAPTYVPRNP
jgi:beta-lactamase superfamily II metal-dependent hydrolase